MAERTLRHCRVLLVEDEYLLMHALRRALRAAGAAVVGPVGTLPTLLAALAAPGEIDGAILDVDLRGEPVFAGADILLARRIPFVFTTGFGAGAIPDRFAAVPRCQKPIELAAVVRVIGRLVPAGHLQNPTGSNLG